MNCAVAAMRHSRVAIAIVIAIITVGGPALSQSRRAQITGVVVDSATGAPVGGVTVSLDGSSAGMRPRQQTDGQGRFGFRELEPGRYILNASRNGYFQSGAAAIALDSGVAEEHTLILDRVSSIAGRVSDIHGRPIVGAFVRVLARLVTGDVERLAAGSFGITDDHGQYRVSGLRAGSYLIQVPFLQRTVPPDVRQQAEKWLDEAIASGIWPRSSNLFPISGSATALISAPPVVAPTTADGRYQVYRTTFFPNARSVESGQPINLGPGEDRPGLNVTVDAVPGIAVSGHLRGQGIEQELVGQELRLLLPGSEALGVGSEMAATTVGPGGEFTFLGVPAGEYVLELSSSASELLLTGARTQLFPMSLRPVVDQLDGTVALRTTTPGIRFSFRGSPAPAVVLDRLTVGEAQAQIDGLVLKIGRGAVVHGTIAWRENTPKPVHIVIAWPTRSGSPRWAVPSRDGSFTISGLQSGQYALRFLTEGVVASLECDGRPYHMRSLEVASGSEQSCVTQLTSVSTGVRGSVRDARGTPAKFHSVLVFPASPELWYYGPDPPGIRLGRTDNRGEFAFDGLPAGEYVLVAAEAPDRLRWEDPVVLMRLSGLGRRATLRWNSVSTVDLISSSK